jgi:hypothetical protein
LRANDYAPFPTGMYGGIASPPNQSRSICKEQHIHDRSHKALIRCYSGRRSKQHSIADVRRHGATQYRGDRVSETSCHFLLCPTTHLLCEWCYYSASARGITIKEVEHDGTELTRPSSSAGVAGLTTALLLSRDPKYRIVVAAKHMPGDYDIEYASPWAGANYMPYVPLAPYKSCMQSSLSPVLVLAPLT